eukprot:2719596-Rhodomonas_salina.2
MAEQQMGGEGVGGEESWRGSRESSPGKREWGEGGGGVGTVRLEVRRLCAYALAMPCAVLSYCYAHTHQYTLHGTELASCAHALAMQGAEEEARAEQQRLDLERELARSDTPSAQTLGPIRPSLGLGQVQ